MIESLRKAAYEVLGDGDHGRVKRISLSTTLSTKDSVQGRVNQVGMIIVSGPGIAPGDLRIGDGAHFVAG